MQKIILTLTAIFTCATTFAHTINWYVGDTLLQTTTCESGNSITPPTAPDKYGYHFVKWKESYTQIEYLKSTGSQYINTNMYLTSDYTVEAKGIFYCGAPAFGEEGSGFGSGSFILFLACTSGGSNWGYGTVSSTIGELGINSENVFILKIDKHGVYRNGTKKISFITSSQTVTSKKFFLLFATKGSYGWSSNALYYVKIYDNDVLVRDFIPVLDKDGTPCLYDRKERKFYYNAGTGQFIAGPVIGE